jgi:formate--tetrahydrofolate ligase
VRALRRQGGGDPTRKDVKAVRKGLPNLKKQISNVKEHNVPVVVAVNKFTTDSKEELDVVIKECKKLGVKARVVDVWAKGGAGGTGLADEVLNAMKKPSKLKFLYNPNDKIKNKVKTIAKRMYGASDVVYTERAEHDIELLEKEKLDKMLICMSKTQKSLSDNPNLLGTPAIFKLKVKSVRASAGAGFLVVSTGDIITMPGLPREPAALNIDIDAKGRISGLF